MLKLKYYTLKKEQHKTITQKFKCKCLNISEYMEKLTYIFFKKKNANERYIDYSKFLL